MTPGKRSLGATYMHTQKTHLSPSVPPVTNARNPTTNDPFFCVVLGPFPLVPAGTIVKWWHLILSEFIKFFPPWNGEGKFTQRDAKG